MSLRVDHGHRGRSKSPGRKDERSRSRDIRAPSPSVQVVIKSTERTSEKSSSKKKHSDSSSDSDSDDRSRKKKSSKKHYSSDSDSESDTKSKHRKSSKKHYDSDSSESDSRTKKKHSKKYYSDSESDEKAKRKSSKKYHDDESDSENSSSSSEEDRRSKHKSSRSKHESHKEYHSSSKSHSGHRDKHGSHGSEHSKSKDKKGHRSNSSHEEDKVLIMPGGYSNQPQYAVVARPEAHRSHSGSTTDYAQVGHYQYAPSEKKVTYSAQPQFSATSRHNSLQRPPSPPSLHRLSVSGGLSGGLTLVAPGQHHHQGGLPPGSPLLEAYHGTYQSISPMPSPLMLASKHDSDLSDIEPLDDNSSESEEEEEEEEEEGVHSIVRSRKHVSIYNPEPDALALAAALKHSVPETKTLIKILPRLTDDHVMMLRTEYKKHMKASGKGVNVAKHIKMKVPGNLGKAAYAVALGRWESEAHWANFWYQSNTSRRELLIESLMGRTNSEIVKIKDAFSDQRYNNSLEKCMQTELKKDKFRNAVLLVLEEQRMSESEKLDVNLVKRDTEVLHRALTAKEGGETAMINIIVVRSDRHLAEVLRLFEAQYRKNFAREMIQRSKNLVGETLAHILNGVLNKPVRDALLLHQALAETSKDRSDLLVSRLVRFHWEPRHLARVKVAYKNKYGQKLESAIEEGTKGEFGQFVKELCRVDVEHSAVLTRVGGGER